MAKIVGREDIQTGGQLQVEIQQGCYVTQAVLDSMMSTFQKVN
jgi:hypothetical protein